MIRLIDKFIIAFICIISSFFFTTNLMTLFSVLFVTCLSCLNSIIDKQLWIKYISLVAFSVLCCFEKTAIVILPILFYDFDYLKHKQYFLLIAIIITPLVMYFSWSLLIIAIINLTICIVVTIKTTYNLNVKNQLHSYQNDIKAKNIKQHQIELLHHDNIASTINLTKIQERNDIALEIHDNVGHILASSILLTGAMIATNTDDTKNDTLQLLKENLQSAMQSISVSVHNNAHNEIYNLKTEIDKIILDFTFCDILLKFDIKSWIFGKEAMHVISIIKESLTNIIKHSNATSVSIKLKEHPAFFQLIINDNGTTTNNKSSPPTLTSIKENTFKLNGTLNVSIQNGFEVFISFPKRSNNL